ncbi:acetyl-coa biotin carboxyl carrier [Lucifera butyrica]|uniref:Biotin carboxyl carrier protein of acetyl-CoA carboxylase n=1 Tax=Lucifera butyrica TaxID=1351585 RepID=A0A498RAN9_9FIRM|nr:acetyl-CoA carboxylase biotin carboxyl carrier protein [Lucifera butyrica]VBB09806.1 acetyl-coa biotin carboxyl carrier [Lucifera butyrica]
MFKLEEVMAIIKAIDQSSIRKFALEQENARLVIEKDRLEPLQPELESGGSKDSFVRQAGGDDFRAEPATTPPVANEPAWAEGKSGEGCLQKIVAPMIGTFYAAPEPGAAPFVKAGQKVQPDAVVCVLEAMKLFNEIEAEVSGEIVEVLVQDEEFVEYGQPLFLVRPD